MWTPLMIAAKVWPVFLIMLNPRFIYILTGILIGGIATLESDIVRTYMGEAQAVYHQVSDKIMDLGNEHTPSLNEETVRQSYENSKNQF